MFCSFRRKTTTNPFFPGIGPRSIITSTDERRRTTNPFFPGIGPRSIIISTDERRSFLKDTSGRWDGSPQSSSGLKQTPAVVLIGLQSWRACYAFKVIGHGTWPMKRNARA